MRDVFKMMDKGAALDFGPAPKETIGALSINLLDRDPDPRRTAFLDQLVAPKTFVGDIMPKLSGPIVVMMGQIPADRVVPATDIPTPVIALAIRMKDPAVSGDIDRMFDGVLMFVNLFASQQGQQMFLSSPDRFAPILSGYDPVYYAEKGQLIEGKREHGVFFANRIFLFADEVALDRFGKHTEFYMARVREASLNPRQQRVSR